MRCMRMRQKIGKHVHPWARFRMWHCVRDFRMRQNGSLHIAIRPNANTYRTVESRMLRPGQDFPKESRSEGVLKCMGTPFIRMHTDRLPRIWNLKFMQPERQHHLRLFLQDFRRSHKSHHQQFLYLIHTIKTNVYRISEPYNGKTSIPFYSFPF